MRAFVLLIVTLLFNAANAHENLQNTVTVKGKGSVQQVPDLLKFTIAVQQKGTNSKVLSRAVNNSVDRILDMLTDNSVQPNDIQAMSISLHPWYERERQTSVQKGFVFSRNINVTLRDFSRYPTILERLLEMDASRIEGFRYEVEDKQLGYLRALKIAMKDAETRAKQLLTTTKRELGEVLNINEATNYRPLAQSTRNMAFSESAQYMPGTNEISATVTVTFKIK